MKRGKYQKETLDEVMSELKRFESKYNVDVSILRKNRYFRLESVNTYENGEVKELVLNQEDKEKTKSVDIVECISNSLKVLNTSEIKDYLKIG